jgi:hypothetical protein
VNEEMGLVRGGTGENEGKDTLHQVTLIQILMKMSGGDQRGGGRQPSREKGGQ